LITAGQVENNINPDDIHRPATRLVEIENTMNKGGGTIYNWEDVKAISDVCRAHGLKLHLDGARLFNALAETGEPPEKYGKIVDSISICLSKGLGAPIGSLLIGDKEFIRQARRVRKAFGGAMRQVGYLAAAGIYALDNNIQRLIEDHERARYLGKLVAALPGVEEVFPVDTNILIFKMKDKGAPAFIQKLKEHDIHALYLDSETVRFVTHLDFTEEMVSRVEMVLRSSEF
jgi:threonine aldolase